MAMPAGLAHKIVANARRYQSTPRPRGTLTVRQEQGSVIPNLSIPDIATAHYPAL